MSALKRFRQSIDPGLLIAALLSLFAIQPLLQPGLPAAADIPIHLYRTMEYERAWAPGVVVPRWAPNLAFGYGYPLFLFAPPLPYLLGMLFHLAGLSYESALKAVIILAIVLHATGMYLLVRRTFNSPPAGLIAAVAFTFSPFSLREAILYGGNVPQLFAIALFPWTLWAISRATQPRWLVIAALSYAAILLSHLFHGFIFTPVVVAYALLISLLSLPRDHWKVGPILARVLTTPANYAVPLGVLLSAFFWLPAFVERFYTRAQADIYLTKSPFFVRYPHWPEFVAWLQPMDARAANPYAPLSLGAITLLLATLGLLVWLWRKPRHRAADRVWAQTLFFGLIAVGAIFMSLPLSQPVWEAVEILQVAEFPWRMLGLANLGLAFLAGTAALWLPPKVRWPGTLAVLIIQLAAIAPLLYPVTGFAQYGHTTLGNQINYERKSQSIGTTTLGEYLPRTVPEPPTGSPMIRTFQQNQQPVRLDPDSLPAGATYTLLEQTAISHRLRIETPGATTLRFYQYHFPGWRATLDGDPLTPRIEPDTGLMLFDIPPGQHTLTVRFGETPIRTAANLISGLTLLGLLIFGLVRLRRGQPAPPSTETQPGLNWAYALGAAMIIILAAFGLKPLLRPLFTLDSPRGQALVADHAASVTFEPGIELIGYDLSQTVVRPGDYMQVTLYWQTDAAPLPVNLQPFVHIDRLDDFTTVMDSTNYTPGDVTTESVLPMFHWDNSRYVRDEHDITVPRELPPMAYAIRVGLLDPTTGERVPLADGSGDTVRLGLVNVAPRGGQPTLAKRLAAEFITPHGPLHLTGYERDAASPADINFRLRWYTERPLATDYTVFTQLLDDTGQKVAGHDSPPLGGAYPTSTWLPGQRIIDARQLPLPALPPGEYRLIVGLYDPATLSRLPTAAGPDFIEVDRITLGE